MISIVQREYFLGVFVTPPFYGWPKIFRFQFRIMEEGTCYLISNLSDTFMDYLSSIASKNLYNFSCVVVVAVAQEIFTAKGWMCLAPFSLRLDSRPFHRHTTIRVDHRIFKNGKVSLKLTIFGFIIYKCSRLQVFFHYTSYVINQPS